MPILEDSSYVVLILSGAILLVAGLIHGTIGLGFPLVATPLLALFLDVRSAILVTLLPTVAINFVSIATGGGWRKSIGKYWPLASYALAGSVVGSHVLVVSDPAPFKLLLAALVLLYLVATRMQALNMHWTKTRPTLSMLGFGLIAGVSAGTTNVMVPILIIYTLELGLTRTAMVQIFNLCFLAGKVSQIGVFASAGLLGTNLLVATLPLAGVAVIALLAGMRVRERIPTEIYRRVMRHVLLVLALLLIGQYVLAEI